MRRPVTHTEKAEADLEAVLDYPEERSPAGADRLAAAVHDRCQVLGQFPELGRLRDELAPGLRSVVVEQYVLFYRLTPAAVEVVRTLHQAREVGDRSGVA